MDWRRLGLTRRKKASRLPAGRASRSAGVHEAAADAEKPRRSYEQLYKEAELINQQNDQAFRNIQSIRYKLMAARTLSELVAALFGQLDDRKVDQVSLILSSEVVEPEGEWRSSLSSSIRSRLLFYDPKKLEGLRSIIGGVSTYIGPIEKVDGLGLFRPEIQTCVLALLLHHDLLIGCLNLGAKSRERFSADRSPDLLEDLAVTAALCLDSVITHERNEKLATSDPLTCVYNRRYFYEMAARSMHLARRHGDALSCLYIDLNDFKSINDRYGHEVGDLALKKTAGFIQSRIRRTDVFARLGGDEFALLLPRVSLAEAEKLAQVLRQGLERIGFGDAGLPELKLSASFGTAAWQAQDSGLDDLLARADQAMYLCKRSSPGGRNQG